MAARNDRPGHWRIPAGRGTRSALEVVLDALAEAIAEEAIAKAKADLAAEASGRPHDMETR